MPWKAAVTEIETLEGMDTWEIVDETPEMNVIDSTWAFRLKCFPDGLINRITGNLVSRELSRARPTVFFESSQI